MPSSASEFYKLHEFLYAVTDSLLVTTFWPCSYACHTEYTAVLVTAWLTLLKRQWSFHSRGKNVEKIRKKLVEQVS